LKDSGFPPSFHTDENETIPTQERTTDDQESFVRIASVDFSGNVNLKFRSRPLDKDIAILRVELDSFDELDRKIRERSDENLINSGRQGCTTDDLYGLVQSFFGDKLKVLAKRSVDDVLEGRQMSTLQDLKKVWTATTNSATGYADDVKDWTEQKLQGKLTESIQIGRRTLEKVSKNPFVQMLQELQKGQQGESDDSEIV
jgi:hypothetical protein